MIVLIGVAVAFAFLLGLMAVCAVIVGAQSEEGGHNQ